MVLVERSARQRPDVAVAIFGESTRHSYTGERVAVCAGNRRKAAALVGHDRVAHADPEASRGILEEAGDVLSWKAMPRIDRPNAVRVDDVQRLLVADPYVAAAQRELGVHDADEPFGRGERDDRRVVKHVDAAAGDDPEIFFAILVHRKDVVPRETIR